MNPLGSTPTTVRSPANIGALVRRRRMELRMTQQDLASMVGTSRRFIGELEDGKETAQIGKVLGVLSNLGIALTAVTS